MDPGHYRLQDGSDAFLPEALNNVCTCFTIRSNVMARKTTLVQHSTQLLVDTWLKRWSCCAWNPPSATGSWTSWLRDIRQTGKGKESPASPHWAVGPPRTVCSVQCCSSCWLTNLQQCTAQIISLKLPVTVTWCVSSARLRSHPERSCSSEQTGDFLNVDKTRDDCWLQETTEQPQSTELQRILCRDGQNQQHPWCSPGRGPLLVSQPQVRSLESQAMSLLSVKAKLPSPILTTFYRGSAPWAAAFFFISSVIAMRQIRRPYSE